VAGGRPAHFETREQLEKAIQDYFDKTVADKGIITITGLAYYLGFESRQSFYDYEKHEVFLRNKKQGYLKRKLL
jgi:hypothetical protein